mmetsp:Transcript_7893/g.9845  ORF Transcript_7893/g.9845 Transcript_7893/m.9845 type:complete len:164 (+) Transcript_7893:131-622(+)
MELEFLNLEGRVLIRYERISCFGSVLFRKEFITCYTEYMSTVTPMKMMRIFGSRLFFSEGGQSINLFYQKKEKKRKYKITTFEWHLRHAMSYFINAFGYMYIFHFLLFISLGNSPLQDFVLNFVEVKFVFEIDNYSTWGLDKEVEIQVLKEGQIPKSGMSEDV